MKTLWLAGVAILLAGCGQEHTLGAHTVRDTGSIRWIGRPGAKGINAPVTPSQFSEATGVPADELGIRRPRASMTINLSYQQTTEDELKHYGQLSSVGTEFGMNKFHTTEFPRQTDFYRLPSPYDGFIFCPPMPSEICILRLRHHDVNVSMPIRVVAMNNWKDIAGGLQHIVDVSVD